ncbi:LOW QUALITY PROTEIN: putative cyclic nucleotide-gated ion channel 9 [Lolium rigidum]|uniref:LOW QUALITY PROTEIN: putative cyclic nucleotide-gated ion channel 9 n=1 Tax=Lolium rigidum TaxID=89674 RepID=UPI001F5DEDAD|nr:LOW QUALITY PROTEIN: putative cyclic nucleotide-gated ion channel 9 [Lolium rigidum]
MDSIDGWSFTGARGRTYLQSLTVRLEEMRVKRRDSEQWMHHRLLPQELRERVRRYDQYVQVSLTRTRGVDEEALVQNLPKDLRRDIKRHLCLGLVRRVPLFDNMDERLLDAICERLKPALYTERTYIIREGDPVDQMVFIIRGSLESITTDGGRSGFFNRSMLQESDFCGEELLTWALDPKSGVSLPSSTRTVMALSEVEAFALHAEELKFVAGQFRRMHSKQVQHTFRFYSQQWRTWAATYIRAAWRRHLKRKAAELRRKEEEEEGRSSSFKTTILVSRFAAKMHRQRSKRDEEVMIHVPVPKPREPDFGIDD